jgi:hypothetical protein
LEKQRGGGPASFHVVGKTTATGGAKRLIGLSSIDILNF